jgi:hypothetical protein
MVGTDGKCIGEVSQKFSRNERAPGRYIVIDDRIILTFTLKNV